jgi:hypothetical protein
LYLALDKRKKVLLKFELVYKYVCPFVKWTGGCGGKLQARFVRTLNGLVEFIERRPNEKWNFLQKEFHF